jgi:hypothetical protein
VKDLRRLREWFKSLFFVRAYFGASNSFSKALGRSQAGIDAAVSEARREAAMRAKPARKTRKKTAAKKKI